MARCSSRELHWLWLTGRIRDSLLSAGRAEVGLKQLNASRIRIDLGCGTGLLGGGISGFICGDLDWAGNEGRCMLRGKAMERARNWDVCVCGGEYLPSDVRFITHVSFLESRKLFSYNCRFQHSTSIRIPSTN